MTPNDRVNQLKAFIAEDPADTFSRYALALEYLKADVGNAEHEFRYLLDNHGDYLPTYYPAAHLMAELGKNDEADCLFKKGIELAQKLGDRKTEMELKSAYMVWQMG